MAMSKQYLTSAVIMIILLSSSCGPRTPTSPSNDHPIASASIATEQFTESPSDTVNPTSNSAFTNDQAVIPSMPGCHLDSRKPTLEQISECVSDVSHWTEQIYVDISGDNELDLIVFGGVDDAAFIWSDGRYSGPYRLWESGWGRGFSEESAKLVLEDWTGDKVPEIVLYTSSGGSIGSGYGVSGWGIRVLHCQGIQCSVIFEDGLKGIFVDDNTGGVCISSTTISQDVDANGVSRIRTTNKHFSIYGCGEFPSDFDFSTIPYLRIDPSVEEEFIWDGSEFQLVESKQVGIPREIPDQSSLSAQNSLGIVAFVTAESTPQLVQQNDICQLYIGGMKIGPTFGCKHNFTSVEWLDVNSNGREDVVVSAFSGASSPGTAFESEKCPHQRMFVYELSSGTYKEIAHIVGCVDDSSLFGVRIEDVDGDGQLEIASVESITKGNWIERDCTFDSWSAAYQIRENEYVNCWYVDYAPKIEIYQWDGIRFSPES